MDFKKALRYLGARITEPSTAAGIATVLLGLGAKVDPGLIQYIDFAIGGTFSVIAMALPEKPQPPTTDNK